MAPNGIYTIADLLAVKNASAVAFGIDKINQVFQADLDYFNSQVNEQLSDLVMNTTEHTLLFGGSGDQIAFKEIDELGSAVSSKVSGGANLSLPLRKFSAAVGWDASYLQLATPAEMATSYLGIRKGYADNISNELKKALFLSANYTWVDSLATGLSLPVKRLLNADGMKIPASYGKSFTASTHTHYLFQAGASLAAADVTKLINHVSEHGGKKVKVYVNEADKSKITALTGFVPLASPVMVYNASDVTKAVAQVDTDPTNMLIGYFDNHEVWVKPYVPAGYMVTVALESAQKPLAMRQRTQTALQGLRLDSKVINAPLQADNFVAEFGFGAYGRQNAAVLYLGTGSYVDPTL